MPPISNSATPGDLSAKGLMRFGDALGSIRKQAHKCAKAVAAEVVIQSYVVVVVVLRDGRGILFITATAYQISSDQGQRFLSFIGVSKAGDPRSFPATHP